MTTPITAFRKRVLRGLNGIPDIEMVDDAIRDAIRELCTVAPIHRRVKTISPVESAVFSPIKSGEDTTGDAAANYGLAAVEAVILDGSLLRRNNNINAMELGIGGRWWDADEDNVILYGLPELEESDVVVWARPPDLSNRTVPYLESVVLWEQGKGIAGGNYVAHAQRYYIARRTLSAADNNSPPQVAPADWTDAGEININGWSPYAAGTVPDGYEKLPSPNLPKSVEVHYSVYSPRQTNEVPDFFFERFAIAIGDGALASLEQFSVANPGYYSTRWANHKNMIAQRYLRQSTVRGFRTTGINRNFRGGFSTGAY